jgi:hypothetical protein
MFPESGEVQRNVKRSLRMFVMRGSLWHTTSMMW